MSNTTNVKYVPMSNEDKEILNHPSQTRLSQVQDDKIKSSLRGERMSSGHLMTWQSRFLVLIIALFLATRLFQLTTTPPSLYWDEASIGYNAYAVSIDGRDEWGDRFPVHFRAFGEFKLPVYVYSTAVLIKIFGLNEWVVRLPAILYSLATILIVYFLAKKISGDQKVGILSAFLLSISPWFFIFSRTGYEATAGLAFFTLGVLAFVYSDKRKVLIIAAAVSFILSMYSYNSYRIISPLVFGVLAIWFLRRESLKRTILIYFVSLFLFAIAFIPIFRLFIYDSGFGRVQSFSLIPNIQQVYDLEGKPHFQIIYDRSKKIDPGETFSGLTRNYFSHFSLDFLFISGDKNARSHQPGFGQLYFIDALFLIIGLWVILKNFRKSDRKIMLLPLVLILLSFVPGSLFKESPHALRSLSALPFLCLISAMGSILVMKRLPKFWLIIPVAYLILFSILCWNFFKNYNLVYANEWQYGYKSIFTNYQEKFLNYDDVYISDDYAQPYIYYLFYTRVNPAEFRKGVEFNPINNWGFSTVSKINNIHFGVKNLENITSKKALIFVSRNEKIKKGEFLGSVKNINGQDLFYVYEYEAEPKK